MNFEDFMAMITMAGFEMDMGQVNMIEERRRRYPEAPSSTHDPDGVRYFDLDVTVSITSKVQRWVTDNTKNPPEKKVVPVERTVDHDERIRVIPVPMPGRPGWEGVEGSRYDMLISDQCVDDDDQWKIPNNWESVPTGDYKCIRNRDQDDGVMHEGDEWIPAVYLCYMTQDSTSGDEWTGSHTAMKVFETYKEAWDLIKTEILQKRKHITGGQLKEIFGNDVFK